MLEIENRKKYSYPTIPMLIVSLVVGVFACMLGYNLALGKVKHDTTMQKLYRSNEELKQQIKETKLKTENLKLKIQLENLQEKYTELGGDLDE